MRDRRGQSLAEVLSRQICQMIIERQMKSGDLLPPEHRLTTDFSVGRSTLREAIMRLRALEVVEVRHGYGTFVSNVAAAVLRTGPRDADPIGDAAKETPSSALLQDLARDLSSLRRRAEILHQDDIGPLLKMAEDKIASRITSATQQGTDEGHTPAAVA